MKDISQMSPLHEAWHIDDIRRLLEEGEDPNIRNAVGMTPLFYAATEEIIQLLLDYGAELEARDEAQRTPFFTAGAQVTDFLVQKGCDIHARDFAGQTALFWADTPEKLEARLAAGCLPNIPDRRGFLPFFFCDHEAGFHLYQKFGTNFLHRNNKNETIIDYYVRCRVQGDFARCAKIFYERAKFLEEIGYNNNNDGNLQKI